MIFPLALFAKSRSSRLMTKKLKFHKDTFYNGQLLYKAGEIHEVTIELGFADRWIRRGAEEVFEVETPEIPVEDLEAPKPRGRRPKKFVGEL
jgi:hypothetical protein